MKSIPLTQGQFALVDDADYELLSRWKWYAWRDTKRSSFYAMRNIVLQNGRKSTVLMHRVICSLEPGTKIYVDHINHDTLDNRCANLRLATNSENSRNSRLRIASKSGFKGVHFENRRKKWVAQITVEYKTRHLGYFPNPESAHAAYTNAAKELHGEFACFGS